MVALPRFFLRRAEIVLVTMTDYSLQRRSSAARFSRLPGDILDSLCQAVAPNVGSIGIAGIGTTAVNFLQSRLNGGENVGDFYTHQFGSTNHGYGD